MIPEIKICPDGIVRLDGCPVFKRVERNGVVYLEFIDRDRMRSACRGSKLIQIPLTEIVAKVGINGNGTATTAK